MTNMNEKEKIELAHLKAEKELFEIQTQAMKKLIYKRPSVLAPLLVAILTSFYGNISLYFTHLEKQEIKKSNVKLKKQISEKQSVLIEKTSYASTLEGLLKKNKDKLEIPLFVHVKFRGDIHRSIITNLQMLLNQSGFVAGKKNAQRTDKIESSIALYNPDDVNNIKDILNITNNYLIKNKCSTTLQAQPDQTIEKGTVDIFIYGDCE